MEEPLPVFDEEDARLVGWLSGHDARGNPVLAVDPVRTGVWGTHALVFPEGASIRHEDGHLVIEGVTYMGYLWPGPPGSP